jgi:hypothetical protein
MTDAIFKYLRANAMTATGIATQAEVVPIEQTIDGWFCLLPSGAVVHLSTSFTDAEPVGAAQELALIGKLSTRFPIATWFLPRGASAHPCPDCGGTGDVPEAPQDIDVVCSCGGIGWIF